MVHVKCASNRVDQPHTAGMLSLAVVLSGRRLWPLCVRHYCQTAGWAAATAANRPADRMERRGNWRSKTDVMNQFEAYMSRRKLVVCMVRTTGHIVPPYSDYLQCMG